MNKFLIFIGLITVMSVQSQQDQRIYHIIDAISADRIKSDIKTLADFGTASYFGVSTFTSLRNQMAFSAIASGRRQGSKSNVNCC